MDKRSVARIAALTGLLPAGWTLADSVAEDDIAAEHDRRRRKQMERRRKRQGAAQRVANTLILKNHRRKAVRRVGGRVNPGRRHERFRPLEKIQADRAALCAFVSPGEAMSARQLLDSAGLGWRYSRADLHWALREGYFTREITGREKPLLGGKASLGLYRRTERAFQGYTPDKIRATIHKRKAMTAEEREADLQAEIKAAIERMEDKLARTVMTRDGRPMAPMEERRRRIPPADWKRIQANRKEAQARACRSARAQGAHPTRF